MPSRPSYSSPPTEETHLSSPDLGPPSLGDWVVWGCASRQLHRPPGLPVLCPRCVIPDGAVGEGQGFRGGGVHHRVHQSCGGTAGCTGGRCKTADGVQRAALDLGAAPAWCVCGCGTPRVRPRRTRPRMQWRDVCVTGSLSARAVSWAWTRHRKAPWRQRTIGFRIGFALISPSSSASGRKLSSPISTPRCRAGRSVTLLDSRAPGGRPQVFTRACCVVHLRGGMRGEPARHE